MCDSDADKQSENGSRSGRRRSSLADALAEVKNAGYNLFKSGSKSSISEVAPAGDEGAAAANQAPPSEGGEIRGGGAVNSLDRANKAAAERDEKLEMLEERSTKLVEGARSFRDNARRLREQAAAGH